MGLLDILDGVSSNETKSLTADQSAFVKSINKKLEEILEKDSRMNLRRTSRELFGIDNFINNKITHGGKPSDMRYILEVLTEHGKRMRDYSWIETDELSRMAVNIADKKGYSKSEVSELMGKSKKYFNVAEARCSRNPLLDIYDFVAIIPDKQEESKRDEKSTLLKKSEELDEKICMVSFELDGEVYYLSDKKDESLSFSKNKDSAKKLDGWSQVEADVIRGKQKIVVEFFD